MGASHSIFPKAVLAASVVVCWFNFKASRAVHMQHSMEIASGGSMEPSHDLRPMLFGALVSRPDATTFRPEDRSARQRIFHPAALTALGVALFSLLAAALS